ncbi:MAG: hypothetical protein NC924_10050 [Candidatus Omnitrophica bacterium]|nr:hypothetical protein [Candidatus Omnitrophota bacterium]
MSMRTALIRVWREVEIDQVRKHLLVAGELTASCENCQHLGIDFFRCGQCPQCGTKFEYISVRGKDNRREELSLIGRLKENRPDLTIIDYDDVKRASGKSKAHDLLGG